MAQPTLTVYAYGNVDALHGIFNSVAMIMNTADFRDMIRVAVVIGFLVVSILMVNPKNISKGWNWFICVAVLSGVLLTPKATVTIEDRLGLQPPAVVANVPWALAVVASVKTAIGATLTDLAETAFQTIPDDDKALPSELAYLEHGVMFGNRLVRASREAEFDALNPQGDTLNYFRNCIFPSLGREGTPGAFERSTGLLQQISDPNPALFSTYHDAANGGALVSAPCDQVFAKLEPDITAAGGAALKAMATRMMPGVDAASAEAKVSESLVAIYGKARLAENAASAQDIMIQNILINATADASALYGASLNDPAVLMFASMRSQAVAATNAGYLVQGRMAEEALPIVRNITDAILYAVFPVLCILAIASEGRALAAMIKSYLYVLVWVELWPLMFSIVSYLQTLASSLNLDAASKMSSGGGLSLQTATGIYSTAISDVAVASWMVTFVPVLAGALLFGMDRVMSIAGSRPGAKQAESEAPQATKGNVNMGNVTLDQQHIDAYRSSPAMATTEGVGGRTVLDRMTGSSRYQHAQSTGPVDLSDTATLAREQAKSASHSLQLSQTESKQAESAVQSAISRVDGLAKSGAFASEGSESWSKAKDALQAANDQDARQTAERLAKQYGLNDVAAVAKALQAGLSIPSVAGIQGSAQLSSNAQKAVSEESSGLRSRSVVRSVETVDRFADQSMFREGHSGEARALSDVRADLQRASSYRESSASRLDEARQHQDTERKLRALQNSRTLSNNNAFYAFAAREGMHPENANISRRQWAETLQRFLNAGEIGRDDEGEFFMPEVGQGPNVMQNTTPEALRGGYAAGNPRGGEQHVLADATARSAQVRQAQNRAGVAPGIHPDGAVMKDEVARAREQASATVETSMAGAKGKLADLQSSSDANFGNAPGQPGTFLFSVSADEEGKGAGVNATHVNQTRPRPGREELDEQEQKRKSLPPTKIPTE